MDPNAGYSAGYPVPTQSPLNQMPFYPNAMAQYPQSKTPTQPGQQQQHSFGAMSMQPGVPGGGTMPPGYPQQSSAVPMDAFSAPFTQPSVPANMTPFSQPGTVPNGPSPVQQAFSQNMASIQQNNLLANQPKPPQMNSPRSTQPGTPAQAQSPAQAHAQAQVQAQIAAREKARVTTLLDINSALLQEVVTLQAAGKAGPASNADANASPTEPGMDAVKTPGSKPTPEYIECMRRLQANLAYLATIADRAKKSGGVAPQAPAIMTPPPNLPVVHDLYQKLNELFPRAGKASTSQKLSPGAMQGNGGPSPSPVSESVI
ncbi:hypothetical protein N7462_008138 [Penicillium macrosclerotiorum]|uniref:uncharacterized protein n=1 Tax=Penicillium macrosclerotiorum TaxID=303699 RepID=UPI002548C5D2|nr:uncharacterized protein N7462_008138 [Penicillium macrosclerotiorum]KAJ5679894.1 hypothetical protein N7462_008138 [Penicillium macrosclerotiorum]